MMPYERFRAWQACDALVIAVYRVARSFPRNELYGLTGAASGVFGRGEYCGRISKGGPGRLTGRPPDHVASLRSARQETGAPDRLTGRPPVFVVDRGKPEHVGRCAWSWSRRGLAQWLTEVEIENAVGVSTVNAYNRPAKTKEASSLLRLVA